MSTKEDVELFSSNKEDVELSGWPVADPDMHACICVCICVYIYTFTYTYIYTCRYTHTR